jgi:hypothetical protein
MISISFPKRTAYRVDCDGQVVNNHQHTCTLLITNQSPYIDIIDEIRLVLAAGAGQPQSIR